MKAVVPAGPYQTVSSVSTDQTDQERYHVVHFDVQLLHAIWIINYVS